MKKVSPARTTRRRAHTLDKIWGTIAERPAGRLLASLRKADDKFGRALNGLADFTTPRQLIVAAQKGSNILREVIAHHGDHEEDGSAEEILEALSVDIAVRTTAPGTDADTSSEPPDAGFRSDAGVGSELPDTGITLDQDQVEDGGPVRIASLDVSESDETG